MPSIKNLFGFRKNKGLDKRIIQKNPYRNNIDLNKRQFIKKGLLGMAGLGGLALASKVAKAGGLVFNDGSTQSAGSLEGTSILSTSETGGTKFLREDGDGTSNWQAAGAGAAILGSTNGNLMRFCQFRLVRDTSGANGIKCNIRTTSGRGFNISSNVNTDVSAVFAKSGSATVGSGATEVTFSLDAGGSLFEIEFAENVSNLFAGTVSVNNGGTHVNASISMTSNKVRIQYQHGTSGADFDVASIANTKQLVTQLAFFVGGAV